MAGIVDWSVFLHFYYIFVVRLIFIDRPLVGAQYFDYSDNGKKVILTKIFAIDPNHERNEEEHIKGYPIISLNYYNHSLKEFKGFPGYYLLETKETRGRNGNPTTELINVKFIRSLKEQEEAA